MARPQNIYVRRHPLTFVLCRRYTNATLIPGEPSLPDEEWASSPMRTFFQTRQPSCFGEPGCTWEKTKKYKHMGPESIAHDMGDIKSLRKHPWRAPGTAPLYSPCGHSGGNPLGCPPGHPGIGNCDAGGYGHGQDARTCTIVMLSCFCRAVRLANPGYHHFSAGQQGADNLEGRLARRGALGHPRTCRSLRSVFGFRCLSSVSWTSKANLPALSFRLCWKFLSEFAAQANHGGGYRFSLCPLPKTFRGRMDVTEECFNQRPLRFAGNSQFIEENLSKKRTEIPAIRTTNGTFPKGSQWTRNPIPACMTSTWDGTGDYNNVTARGPHPYGSGGGDQAPCFGPQFPPPVPYLCTYSNGFSAHSHICPSDPPAIADRRMDGAEPSGLVGG